ncbi:uncharacterized protein ZSWIM9-like [Pleurodeles waltl]
MNGRAKKKKLSSIYTPEEENVLQWKRPEYQKGMIYIGSALRHWREVKAENNLRRDKDLAIFLLQLYWKIFKSEAEPPSMLDILEGEDSSSSDVTNSYSPPASPRVPEEMPVTIFSIPFDDPSPMEFIVCKEVLKLDEDLQCPQPAFFTTDDPMCVPAEQHSIQTQDGTNTDNCETYEVPDVMVEEEVVAVSQTEGDAENPSEEGESHHTGEGVLGRSEEWYFQPTQEEDGCSVEDKKFELITEYNVNETKDKIATERSRRRKNTTHNPNVQNITSLHEEDDLLGKEFFSWEEFCRVFDTWCERKNTLFYIQNATPLGKCEWRTTPPQPEVVDALHYSSVHLLCKESKDCGAHKTGSLSGNKNCSAKVVLNISQNKDCLVVTECQSTHNHVLCPIKFNSYKKGFLLSSRCLPVHVTNIISRQFLELRDVKRLLSNCSAQETDILEILNALKMLFAEDPLTKVKLVFMEDTATVKMVYFQTSEMLRFCQRLPSALFFDRILDFNDEFDLYTVLCLDGDGLARECAHCLARRGIPGILHGTLASLLQITPELKHKVQHIIVGVEVDELSAIQQVLPQSRVWICRHQVLETLTRKARELGTLCDERVQPLLCEVVQSMSIDCYHRAVKKLKEVVSEHFMNYFLEHWHPRSVLWAEFSINSTNKGINTYSAIKQHRQRLSWAIRPFPTLAQCLEDLLQMHASKVEVGFFNDTLVAARYREVCQPEQSHLIEEELALANLRTYDISENMMNFVLNDGVSNFVMDPKLISCSCSIYTSNLLPCRHLFATRFMTGQALVDANLLVKKEEATAVL